MRKSIWLGLALAGAMVAQTAGRRAAITQAVDESRLVRLAGNTRPEATPANDLGAVADGLRLDMYLQLKRPSDQELAARQFVESLTDKSSPNFHKWITAAQYGQRFGAADEDIATVSRWLKSHGFTVNGVPANNMTIDFSGNAGQVREALHTEIHNLDVAGERRFANMSDPQIPEALLPAVTGVVSMNNFRPRTMFVPKGQYTVSSRLIPVVPGDLATIYNLNPAFAAGFTGQGQTVVVVEDTDLYGGSSDWNTFRKTFGLAAQYPSGSLTQVHPAPGAGGSCPAPGVNGNDSEAALDVEWASAAAPNAAIVMASCSDTTNFGGFIALQNLLTNGGALPNVVSISYGQPETDGGATFNGYINTLYQTAAAAGVSVFVSSGDSTAVGADSDASVAIHGVGVSSFASTIYNVAVGGTDFGDTASSTSSSYWSTVNGPYYNSAKRYVREIPWNDSCAGGILAGYYGVSAAYGPESLCNSRYDWLDTDGGSGGPSGCATGSPSLPEVVSGTCAGFAKPSWQSIFGNPSDGVRDTPDVSLFASNGFWGHYYVFCVSDGGSCTGKPSTWPGAGGTSFASPIMAGIQALINQALGSNVGNPNPVYYQIGQNEYNGAAACDSTAGPAAGCAFNDVTQGDIVVPCAGAFNCYLGGGGIGALSASSTSWQPAYATTAGWDFATGIGTVNGFNLLNAFVASVASTGAPAALSVAKAHSGDFMQGQNGATYTVTVSNVAAVPTSGPVTATDTLPSGLTLVSMAGDGWTCAGNSCMRSDSLAAAASYPPITVTVNVAQNATSPQVNSASVSGGASAPASATDSTIIDVPCAYTLNYSGQSFPVAGGAGSVTVTASSSGCAWTATSGVSWATITGGGSGTGTGAVAYQVAANAGGLRSGGLTVAGLPFTVEQASATATGLALVGSMAQLATGAGWNTTITLLNTGAAAEAVLNFYDDNGNPLALPLTLPGATGAPLVASTLDQPIGAGAQLTIQTVGTASQANVEGWAQLLTTGGNVGGSAVFAWTTPAGAQEVGAPVEVRNPSAFVLPFDYTGGYQTGVAVANLSNQAVSIPVVLTDNTGASLGPAAAINLAAYGHISFMLAGTYPAVAGTMGALEMDTPAGAQISAMGIRASPGGAFTSVPVLAK